MMSYMTAERSGMKYVSLLSSENIFKCWGILGGRPHTKTALNVQDVPDGNSWKSVYLLAALSLCWLLPVATNCSTSLQSLHSLGWGLSANQATSAQLRCSAQLQLRRVRSCVAQHTSVDASVLLGRLLAPAQLNILTDFSLFRNFKQLMGA